MSDEGDQPSEPGDEGEPERVDGTANPPAVETAATVHTPNANVSAPAQPAEAVSAAAGAGTDYREPLGDTLRTDAAATDAQQMQETGESGGRTVPLSGTAHGQSDASGELTVSRRLDRLERIVGPTFGNDDVSIDRSITEQRVDRSVPEEDAVAIRAVLESILTLLERIGDKISPDDYRAIDSAIQSAIAQTKSSHPNAEDLGRSLTRLGVLLDRLGTMLVKAAKAGVLELPKAAARWGGGIMLEHFGDDLLGRSADRRVGGAAA